MSARRRVDVHQHAVPPSYAEWLRAQRLSDAGGRALPDWSAEEALGVMDAHEIERAILSISTPGVRRFAPTHGSGCEMMASPLAAGVGRKETP